MGERLSKAHTDALRKLAASFLIDDTPALETARAIAAYHAYECPAEVEEIVLAMTGIDSETDDILVGERRNLWHPEVRQLENQKHDDAQAWARPMVRQACETLVQRL